MSTKNKTKELFNAIIEDFISKLEQGNNPFNFGRIQPISGSTNKPYKNLNKLILAYKTKKYNFKSAKWLTYNQVTAKGGLVKKGSKGTPIFLYKNSWVAKVIKNGEEVTMWSEEKTEEDAIAEIKSKKDVTEVISIDKKRVFKHHYVYNYDQTTLEDNDVITKPEQPSALTLAVSKFVSYEQGESIRYDYEKDCICGVFNEKPFDYSLFYKAVIESTKHENRLNRNLEYVEEELVKLIGSSYLLSLVGLEQSKVAPDLASIFIEKLKASPNSIWKYAREADKAYNMVSTWIESIGK